MKGLQVVVVFPPQLVEKLLKISTHTKIFALFKDLHFASLKPVKQKKNFHR
jgi:hypothetical protein